MDVSKKQPGMPIDKGWAWMIVLGAFGAQATTTGLGKSFGALYPYIQDTYNSSNFQTSQIQALLAFLFLGSGPLASTLAERYSYRRVVIAGGLVGALGYILCSFTPSYYWLLVCYGGVVGIGSGLLYAPSVVIVGKYFEDRRPLANGLSVAGGGVGGFLYPPAVTLLVEYFSLRAAFIVLGGLFLQNVVCGALYRPLSFYYELLGTSPTKPPTTDTKHAYTRDPEKAPMTDVDSEEKLLPPDVDFRDSLYHSASAKDVSGGAGCDWVVDKNGNRVLSGATEEEEEEGDEEDSGYSTHTAARPILALTPRPRLMSDVTGTRPPPNTHQQASKVAKSCHHIASNEDTTDRLRQQMTGLSIDGLVYSLPSIVHTEGHNSEGSGARTSLCCVLQWSIFKSHVFLLYLASFMLAVNGYNAMMLMVTPHGRDVGLTASQSSLLLAMLGAADLVSRPLAGLVVNRKLMHSSVMLGLGLVVAGACLIFLMPHMRSLAGLLVCSIIFGFFGGTVFSLMPVVLVDALGVDKLPSSFGVVTLGLGVMAFASPFVNGGLRDAYGTWVPSIYLSGASHLVSGIMVLSYNLVLWYRSRRRSQS